MVEPERMMDLPQFANTLRLLYYNMSNHIKNATCLLSSLCWLNTEHLVQQSWYQLATNIG